MTNATYTVIHSTFMDTQNRLAIQILKYKKNASFHVHPLRSEVHTNHFRSHHCHIEKHIEKYL